MRKLFFLLPLVLCFALPSFSQTFSCPSGTEDMLNYVIMGYPKRADNHMGPGNANPIYSYISPEEGSKFAPSGYLMWIKDPSGAPWDVKAFDQNYVYDRTTEYNWTDPTSFRRWNTDLPMFRRCVPVGKPGPTLRVPSSATNYSFYQSCSKTQQMNLGYVLNSITAPTWVQTGGSLGMVLTRYFMYRYACNSSYNACTDLEVFSLGRGVGLYDWKHYVNKNGSFVLVQDALINSPQVGQTTPNTPCMNSYQ